MALNDLEDLPSGFPLNPLRLGQDNPYQTSNVLVYSYTEYALHRYPINYTPQPTDALHIVREGQELDLLADHYYGNSKLWWVIAEANKLFNPFILEVGTSLIIPDLDYLYATKL